jgi:hypothetical protein
VTRHEEGEAPAVGVLKLGANRGEFILRRRLERQRAFERGIGALIAHVHARRGLDVTQGQPLCSQLSGRRRAQPQPQFTRREQTRLAEFALERRLAHGGLVGKSHAVGREHTGQRMDVDPRHAERVRDQRGVLAAGTAKALQGITGEIVSAHDGNAFHRIRHIAHGNPQRAGGQLLRRQRHSRPAHFRRQCGEAFRDHGRVQGLPAILAEHGGEG